MSVPPPNIQMGSSPKFHETRDTLQRSPFDAGMKHSGA